GILSPEATSRFDHSHYERILRKNVPDLVAADGGKAITLLSELLERAIELSLHQPSAADAVDYSYIWRPRIERTDTPTHGIKDLLAGALFEALLQVGKRSP